MQDQSELVTDMARIINLLAPPHEFLKRKPSRSQLAAKLSLAVEKVHDAFGDMPDFYSQLSPAAVKEFFPERMPVKTRSKYPWHAVAEVGDSFLWPYEGATNRNRVRARIVTHAHKLFGPGAIRTNLVPSGILVTRIA